METNGLREKLFLTQRKKIRTEELLMLLSFPKKRPTLYNIKQFLSWLYIFRIFVPSLLLLPPRVPPPSGSPSLCHWTTLSQVIGAILRVGRGKREKKKGKREKNERTKKERVIISNIILRLEVSGGHYMSSLKYKVREYQPVVFMSLSLLIVRRRKT